MGGIAIFLYLAFPSRCVIILGMNPAEQLLEDRLLKFAAHPAIRDARMYAHREQQECMADVSAVLQELFPQLFEFPVNVSWRSVGPYVNWETWESDRYICLSSDTNSFFYAQIAFQLFHELAHLAIGYTPDTHWERHGERRNITAWFPETICIALSYVGLSRLTDAWKTSNTSWKRSFSYSFMDNRYENVNNQIRKLGPVPVDVSAYLRQYAVDRLKTNYNDKTVHGALAIRVAEMIEEHLSKDVRSVLSLTSVETHTHNDRGSHFQFTDIQSWVDSQNNEHGKKDLAADIYGYLHGIDVRLTEFVP